MAYDPLNPPWEREEMILVLDLYLRYPPKTFTKAHAEAGRLSDLLKAPRFDETKGLPPTFPKGRRPEDVCEKLREFDRLEAMGMPRIGKTEGEVWDEFYADPDALAHEAKLVSRRLEELTQGIWLSLGLFNISDFDRRRGRNLFHVGYDLHRRIESPDGRLAKRKLDQAELPACEACGFDFFATYGELGQGFIECHYRGRFATPKTATRLPVKRLSMTWRSSAPTAIACCTANGPR